MQFAIMAVVASTCRMPVVIAFSALTNADRLTLWYRRPTFHEVVQHLARLVPGWVTHERLSSSLMKSNQFLILFVKENGH